MFENSIQPSIHLLGLRIDEPITCLTDLVLAAICFHAFNRLRKSEQLGKLNKYFRYYFLILGMGAALGGLLGHAFLYALGPGWKLVSWVLTMVAVTLISLALIEAARPLIKPFYTRMISSVTLLVLAVAVYYTLWTMAFSPVKYFTIFGMVLVTGSLSYFIFQKTRNRGASILMGALGIAFLSVFIFSFGWGLGPWLNHNDISHLILSYSAFSIYKGAVVLVGSSPLV